MVALVGESRDSPVPSAECPVRQPIRAAAPIGVEVAVFWLHSSEAIMAHPDPHHADIVSRALATLEERARDQSTLPVNTLAIAASIFRLRMAPLEREEFHVAFLCARHRVIEVRTMFMGTLTRVNVYPREVLRAALLLNAAAVVVAHNHPSGSMAPSAGDDEITWSLRSCLQQLDVNLLDHLIVTGGGCYSYAAEGRLAPAVPTRSPAAPKRARRAAAVVATTQGAYQ